MKKVGDLFEELGFRKDASDGVKRAFVENLVKAAGQTLPAQAAVKAPAQRAPIQKTQARETQLSFNFDALEARGDGGPEAPSSANKRNAG